MINILKSLLVGIYLLCYTCIGAILLFLWAVAFVWAILFGWLVTMFTTVMLFGFGIIYLLVPPISGVTPMADDFYLLLAFLGMGLFSLLMGYIIYYIPSFIALIILLFEKIKRRLIWTWNWY